MARHTRATPGVYTSRRICRVLMAHPRDGADLAAAMAVEHPVGLADETRGRQLVDALVQRPVRILVHLEGDFPQGAALLAPQRGQVLEHQAFLGDDLQHLGEAAGLMQHLDDDDFRDFHGRRRFYSNWRRPPSGG